LKAPVYTVLFVTLSLLASFQQVGQAQPVDTLEARLRLLSLQDRIKLLNNEAQSQMRTSPTRAMMLAKKALQMTRDGNIRMEEAMVLKTLASIYYFVGDYQETIALNLEALSVLQESANNSVLVKVLTCLGDAYYDLREFANAERYYEKLLAAAQSDDDRALAYNNLGNTFYDQGNENQAIEYYLRAIGFEGRVRNRKPVYDAYENLAMILVERNKVEGAMRFFQKALSIEIEDEAVEDVCLTKLHLASMYLKLGEKQRARDLAYQALETAIHIGARPVILEAYRILPDINIAMGKVREAYETERMYSELADSLFHERMARHIAEAQTRFELHEKNVQIDELEQQRSVMYWQIITAVAVLSMLSVILFLVYRGYRRHKEDARLLESLNSDLTAKNDQLHQSERKLTELNIGKDKLFSVLAHDLKSPFNSLLGYLQVLEGEHETMQPDERRQFLHSSLQAATRLVNHVETLLNWTRMQMGRMELHPEVLVLSTEVSSVLNLLRESASKKDIDLVNEIPQGVRVSADRSMIRSLVQNLVSNAIKFSNHEGKVQVEAFEEPGWVHMSFIDDGVGMNEETRQSLFRLDTSVSTRGTDGEPGTGLGLIICNEIITKHAGRIEVYSEPGKGTTFVCSLPVDPEGLLGKEES
jgi:signal transduction histidine kinase